jgi:biopolymer transport protein ExbB
MILQPRLRHVLLIAVLFASLFLAHSTGFAADAEGGAGGHGEMSIMEMIMDGGPLIMAIWVAIVGTSIIMVTLIVQNSMVLRKDKLAPPPLIDSLQQTINAGNYQEAWETCNANNNYVANVLKAGLSRLGRGREAVGDAVSEHGLREATLLRTRNSYLSVIGVVAPMIGLLGTVFGMLGAFAVLAGSGISDPRQLSGKIGEVLLATASGLFIAIPAFVAYYVFRNRSQMCIVHADDVVNNLLYDIPYEELQGVHIGQNFNAGVPDAGFSAGARKVSMALTTNCPVCNGGVTAGVNPCPHCGATLDWAA